VIGDRYGRKVNLMRTLWGSAILTALTALAPNVYVLVMMRFVAGTMAGVFSTSLALVSSQTPSRRRGYAIGMMQVAFLWGWRWGR